MTMELLLALGLGIVTAAGTWLLLRARAFDVILGLTLLSYAVNMFIFLTGRIRAGRPPIVSAELAPTLAHYADPLPQALVLTAIVISFAMTALILVIALRAHSTVASDHVDGGRAADTLDSDSDVGSAQRNEKLHSDPSSAAPTEHGR